MSEASARDPACAAPAEPASAPWEDPPRGRAQATSLVLAVNGFEGPLDWLLEMARAKKIDLARLSIVALVDAFVGAMQRAFGQAPARAVADLSRWAAWTVTAAQLTELRSRLLLPPPAPQAGAAQGEAEALRQRLIRREQVAASADWLERRPQLGVEVFARGRPERFQAPRAAASTDGQSGEAGNDDGPSDAKVQAPGLEDDLPVPGGDLTDLLRACLAALRLPPGTAATQSRRLPFWTTGEAAARIARLLNALPDGAEMAVFLPEIAEGGPGRALRCRAAVAATLVDGLELACNGAVGLDQDALWQPITIHRCAPDAEDAA